MWIVGAALSVLALGCESEGGEGETGAEETGAEETGAEETGAEETGDEETGDEETGDEETGAEETGEEPEATLSNINDTIFALRCSFCHTELAASSGEAGKLKLDGTDLHDSLVGVESEFAPQLDRVVPGDPENSFLMVKILGMQGFGEGDPMPPTGSLLSEADIDLIRQWILDGAEDN